MAIEIKTSLVQDFEYVLGQKIEEINSSLSCLTIRLNNKHTIVIQTNDDADRPNMSALLLSEQDAPKLEEAVCKVDWSWAKGLPLSQFYFDEKFFCITIAEEKPVRIGVSVWKDKPYLYFQRG